MDRESAYQEQLAKIGAQVSAFKRSKLSAAFLQQEVAKRAAVSDEEARDYFERNAVQLRTEMHVWQILRRDSNSIEQALHDLVGGIPFELVDMRENPAIAFGDAEPEIMKILRNEKQQKLQQEIQHELREPARIIYP